MALASFFDKAALAVSQVLKGVGYADLENVLNSSTVAVALDNAAASQAEGRSTLELLVNLLARLYPTIAISPNGAAANVFATELAEIATAINPAIAISSSFDGVSVGIAVGDTKVDSGLPFIYLGSDGWVTKFSSRAPVGSGSSRNPFGAGAAACFGAANVFRIAFRTYLPYGTPDDSFAMSLLDYTPNVVDPSNPPLRNVNLGECHLIGLGAIGNGAIWALSRLSSIRGILHLIDDETIDLGNLQRYVLSKQTDKDGGVKVEIAKKMITSPKLKVYPHKEKWGEYLRRRESWNLEYVAVAVDSAEDRRRIQAALPRWMVNAWTQEGDLGVSRHSFVGDQACLMCLYMPDGAIKNEDELIAEAIGLPSKRREIGKMLYQGAPIDKALIEEIASSLRVPAEPLLQFEGKTLRAFYTEAICGGTVMRLGGSSDAAPAEVPMAFQSALAGIMLSAELVAHATGLKQAPPPVTTKIDLLRPLGQYLSLPATKHPSGRCICQDLDYIAAYNSKYPVV